MNFPLDFLFLKGGKRLDGAAFYHAISQFKIGVALDAEETEKVVAVGVRSGIVVETAFVGVGEIIYMKLSLI